MKCYAKSSENLIVQLANLPPKPPFLSKSFHLFSCTGKTHYLCISSAKNKEQNKTFLPFNFQNIGRQLVQYAASELQPPASDKHVLVEIEDACRIIKKAKPTIYTLVRKGILPAYKKGKKLYFYEDELLAWIENGRRKTAEQTYEEMLANMQSGVRHKPKSSVQL